MNDCKRRGKKERDELADGTIANSMKVLMLSSILMMGESGDAEDSHSSIAEIERPVSKVMLKAKTMENTRTMRKALLRNKPILRQKQKIFSRKF